MVLVIHTAMTSTLPLNRCRMCGAASYRPVIDRDWAGAMRASGLYRCSGCSVVFADPRAWRDGGAQEIAAADTATAGAGQGAAAPSPAHGTAMAVEPRAPDWRTYGTGPA